MKRILCLVLLAAILLMVPAYAVESRSSDVFPVLSFSGTTATCTVNIFGAYTTDRLSATMELWQGDTLIDEWSASGYGVLNMEETATVRRNKTYTLTVEFSVNGVAQTPVSISRTNR